MKEIYFINNGETYNNKLNIYCNTNIEILINDIGIKQAKLTGKYLREFRMKNKEFNCIISSNLKRAIQTANIIADEIDYKDEIIKLDIQKENNNKLINKDSINMFIDKIKDPIKKYEMEYIKFTEIEKEINKSCDEIIKYIENNNCDKIIIVSHTDLLIRLIAKLFNLNCYPPIDKYGNCFICYVIYKNNKYIMKSPINNKHLYIKYN